MVVGTCGRLPGKSCLILFTKTTLWGSECILRHFHANQLLSKGPAQSSETFVQCPFNNIHSVSTKLVRSHGEARQSSQRHWGFERFIKHVLAVSGQSTQPFCSSSNFTHARKCAKSNRPSPAFRSTLLVHRCDPRSLSAGVLGAQLRHRPPPPPRRLSVNVITTPARAMHRRN